MKTVKNGGVCLPLDHSYLLSTASWAERICFNEASSLLAPNAKGYKAAAECHDVIISLFN